MIDLLPQINEWFARGEEIAVATVIRVIGSAPRPVGARMIVSSEGHMAGSVSGGCVETTVYEEMMEVLDGGSPRKLHFGITEDMIWDVGLACGGTIDVFLQALEPELVAEIKDVTVRIAKELGVVGMMNVQYAVKEEDGRMNVYVLEVNPRASRTVPFVSKTLRTLQRGKASFNASSSG